ncbi:hypothetical protein PsYK624_146730 [Phanerochaete sordida]|uniref:Uncharacterized protein n=1 Tax=Phanerochaete sordida TaxID=48140 RepID=A0A9P3LKD5_9APHY|nr:hypothetical protein PsYK624_146730 [Phanerochaete sordida]
MVCGPTSSASTRAPPATPHSPCRSSRPPSGAGARLDTLNRHGPPQPPCCGSRASSPTSTRSPSRRPSVHSPLRRTWYRSSGAWGSRSISGVSPMVQRLAQHSRRWSRRTSAAPSRRTNVTMMTMIGSWTRLPLALQPTTLEPPLVHRAVRSRGSWISVVDDRPHILDCADTTGRGTLL